MSEENRKPINKGSNLNSESAEAAFCEELLCCLVCGKVYFSKNPLDLRTVGDETFQVCLDCSRKLNCSSCGKSISVGSTLVMENVEEATVQLLCPDCRDRVLLDLPPAPMGAFERFQQKIGNAVRSIIDSIRKIMSARIRFRK